MNWQELAAISTVLGFLLALAVAWRKLWREKARLIVTAVAVGVGVLVTIVLVRHLFVGPEPSPEGAAHSTPGFTPGEMSPVPGGICGNYGLIPPLPSAPPDGCVLIVEWWVPPSADAEDCGILMTHSEPDVSPDAIGTWFYVYPNRVDSHIREFQQRNPLCGTEDLR